MWGEPRFVFLLFLTTLVDFYVVKKMDAYEAKGKRKLFLILSVSINLGLLFYFKYSVFLVENLNNISGLLHLPLRTIPDIILPIGISFYTFESVTYAVDVYRKIHKPLDKFWEYQMYIIFFPKLIAGPIVRYHEIADQIEHHVSNDSFKNRVDGFIRFCVGLGKKVLIANSVAQQADAIFALPPEQLTTTISWLGALAYTLQIYFDFSGYSDMAIGLALMLGFRLPENFNDPYTSKSITEFWKRWHITLGNWMRNYLYIPMGGNRVVPARILFNLFLVFVLSGLWHGAGWNFVLWGVYYGCFLVAERLLISKGLFLKGIWSCFGWAYTFVVVIVGWVLFRVENIGYAFKYIRKMFSFEFSENYVFIYKPDFFYFLIPGFLGSIGAFSAPVKVWQDRIFKGELSAKSRVALTLCSLFIFMVCLVELSGGQYNPFIYFKF